MTNDEFNKACGGWIASCANHTKKGESPYQITVTNGRTIKFTDKKLFLAEVKKLVDFENNR